MNPKRTADLLASAVRVLTRERVTFVIKPWKEILMPKALAESKKKELKNAQQKTGAKPPPKHVSAAIQSGVDTGGTGMVNSGLAGFSAFNPQIPKGISMNPKQPVHVAAGEASTVDKAAMAKAKADQAVKDAAAKAEKAHAKTDAAEKTALERQAKKAEREAKANESKEQREARIAELKTNGHTYTGSMLALADRVKAGLYVKSMTGQLRSNDDIAQLFDAVPPENVVIIGCKMFGETNKYTALNIGQQSMNYRNRLRGAVRKAVEINRRLAPRMGHGLKVRQF